MLWLLALNMALIAVLAWIVLRRYREMRNASGAPDEVGLVRRILVLFSLAAIVPATVVALFLGVTITRGINNWFSERVDTIVERTADVARATVDDYRHGLEADALQAAVDFKDTVEPSIEVDFLTAQVAFGAFFAAFLVDDSGALIAQARGQGPNLYRAPDLAVLKEAAQGDIEPLLFEKSGLATVVVPSRRRPNEFLYFYREFDPNQIAQLRQAEEALNDFRTAEARSARLQWLFAIGYTEIAALILLMSWRLGLEAAGRLTGPIGRLANAAHAVKDGDLTVRVPLPAGRDELYALSQSFNAMTEQLAEQRAALVAAREDADDRRQFLETLLTEVSAGVIRTDGDLLVTQSNRSAEQLLGRAAEQSEHLADINKEFAALAERTIRSGGAIDTTFEFSDDGDVRHFRVKTALDPAGGCVMTFDDTSGLVNAQRQLAWRDVARRIAHEIRNPLTPIQLSTERLRRRYSQKIGEDDGVFERCLDTILRQVSDIGRMVEEFSAFARMPKPSLAPFAIGDLIERVGFAQNMVSPDIAIDVRGAEDAPIFMGDERLLGQAFGNLIKNAAQAIEADPAREEGSGRITISIKASEDAVMVEIADNGPGFPAEARDRLLEPYVTTRSKGTGLGLAIVNRIILDHDGTISLQNREDGSSGAVVRINLPNTMTAIEAGADAAAPLVETAESRT